MYYFHNDYNEICHPAVFKYLHENAGQPMNGYGEDPCCERAAEMIRNLCGDDVAVHFLTGGTQSNLTVISAALRPHQAVLAADSAHVEVHETGAIEATGHKVLPLPSHNGKISAQQISECLDAHWADVTHEHMPQPKLVYISQPTELGTVYTRNELEAIFATCKKYGLYLFVDGARLGYAFAAEENDLTMADLARFSDVFYIGGTKVGAMFGEAVVISNPVLKDDFRYIMKQRGAMLAKGWVLGLQFEALLNDGLYFKIARNANILAERIRNTLREMNYPMPVECGTNQVFVTLPLSVCSSLEKNFTFSPWGQPDQDHLTVRFCTSWATDQVSVDALCNELRKK